MDPQANSDEHPHANEAATPATLSPEQMMEAGIALLNAVPGPFRETVESVMEFRLTLYAETDRGCALMAAAYLDEQLKDLIKARLVDDKKHVKRVFEYGGALGTFATRIDFAFLLGILPKNAHRDLHRLRAIRNKFAHVVAPISFDHEEVAPMCKAFEFGTARPENEPRYRFERAMLSLVILIVQTQASLAHIVAATDADTTGAARAAEFTDESIARWQEKNRSPSPTSGNPSK